MGWPAAGRRLACALALGIAACWAGTVEAGYDYSCEPSWQLAGSGCDGRVYLTPGNDTRLNLLLLLDLPLPEGLDETSPLFIEWDLLGAAARGPAARPGWQHDSFEGTRCQSVTAGDASFAEALEGVEELTPWDRGVLRKARKDLHSICEQGPGPAPSAKWAEFLDNPAAEPFLAYLDAAAAFYGEDWAAARSGFSDLSSAAEPWVAETARYMLIRVELNVAQAPALSEWGHYEGPNATDKAAAARAGEAIEAYLERYPKGRFAASAEGLRRRVAWLVGDRERLATHYDDLLNSAVAVDPGLLDLLDELDAKLLMEAEPGSLVGSPLLLAAHDLMRMRTAADNDWGAAWLTKAELTAQERHFRDRPELLAFLHAARAFHVDGDARAASKLLPNLPDSRRDTNLAFSAEVLRGIALESLRVQEREAHWLRLLASARSTQQRGLVQLALAASWDRNGQLKRVFATDSPVTESAIRERVLTHAASLDLLRKVTADPHLPEEERRLAGETLLQEQLIRRQYAGFLADFEVAAEGTRFEGRPHGDDQDCPPLVDTIRTLADNPLDAAARLCVARSRGGDEDRRVAREWGKDELGGVSGVLAGEVIPLSAIYRSIIQDSQAPGEARAEALYRALDCYSWKGINHCGGEDVPLAGRTHWYRVLQRDYPDSRWAKEAVEPW